MNQLKSASISVIKYLLFSTAFMPLIVLPNFPFSYVLGKMIFFRSVVEIAVILFLVYLLTLIYTDKKPLINADKNNISINQLKSVSISAFKNSLFLSLFFFFISLIISVIFAVNSYRAFWGDLERGEGLFGFLHFFAFLIMSAVIFKKKDWLNFFKISLGVGFVLIVYAFLQYFNFHNFYFMKVIFNSGDARPISLIGNPAFLATHMFFVIMFAIIVYMNKNQHQSAKISINQRLWKYFSLLIIILAVLTIFITATRGAILGLGAVVLFLLLYFAISGYRKSDGFTMSTQSSPQWARKMSIVLLVVLVLFSSIFIFTRHNMIWQKVPGLNRLAKTATHSVQDASTQFRLITWKLSWGAFKQKPLFGWGLENYLVAYEKNYNPDYALYGESWMDRAHNKIFDLLVMQGVFGLLTYLGIFGALFYYLYHLVKPLGVSVVFIMAGLIGYFIQNLFIMDQLISNFMFFAVIGLIFNKSLINADNKLINTDKKIGINQQNQHKSAFNIIKFLITLLFIAIIVILIYSLYSYNYISYVQMKAMKDAGDITAASMVEKKIKEAVYPYNFVQFNLRAKIIDYYYDSQPHIFEDASFRPLADFLKGLIDEIIQKEPYDARMFIRKAQMLQSMALNNSELYKEAEEAMRKAVEISPTRQEVYYNLSFALLGQNKFEEALEIAKKAVELSPNVARAHYHLAFVMAVISPQYKDEIIQEMDVADRLSPGFESLRSGDHNIIALIYSRINRPDKVADTIIKKINLGLPGKFIQTYYEESLGYFAAMRDAKNFIKVAKDAIDSIPKIKEDMNIYIDLAEKGNWEIIDSLSR